MDIKQAASAALEASSEDEASFSLGGYVYVARRVAGSEDPYIECRGEASTERSIENPSADSPDDQTVVKP